jgi:hypothetical protein
VERHTELRLSHEATSATWVTLAALTAPGVYRRAEIMIRGATMAVSGYHLDEGLLWGMTERILTPVIRSWEELISGNH